MYWRLQHWVKWVTFGFQKFTAVWNEFVRIASKLFLGPNLTVMFKVLTSKPISMFSCNFECTGHFQTKLWVLLRSIIRQKICLKILWRIRKNSIDLQLSCGFLGGVKKNSRNDLICMSWSPDDCQIVNSVKLSPHRNDSAAFVYTCFVLKIPGNNLTFYLQFIWHFIDLATGVFIEKGRGNM